MVYETVNEPVLLGIPDRLDRVLDVGCGTGALGALIKKRSGSYVVGITFSSEEAKLAQQRLDAVLVRDLEELGPLETDPFDLIIFSHVLEHVSNPGSLLRTLAGYLIPGGRLVAALPNALHWRQRLEFLRGNFRYADGGVMDRTHLRFFDWVTARRLFESSGYDVIHTKAHGTFPASRFLGPAHRVVDRLAIRASPGLFGTQFILTCQR
jgi:SAM-dependent methyltransferase